MSELHHQVGEERSSDPRDPPPEGVRVLGVAEGQSAVPRAFSADVIAFDQEPADEELVAMLGREPGFRPRREETADGFRVREAGVPVRPAAAWTGLVAAAVCGLILATSDDSWPERVGLCLLLVATAAGTVAAFWGIDRHLRAQPDALRVDRARGVLEAPGSGLRVPIEEVIACVRLKRWWARPGGEEGGRGGDVVQLGVLVPAGPRLPGRVAYHPLAHELVMAGPRDRVIDGVIEELGRPVRRVNLTLDEVWALGPGC